MSTRYEGFDAEWTRIYVHPSGTPVEVADWDQEFLTMPAIDITNGDSGALIEGSKIQLVEMLERALDQARSLPDEPATDAASSSLDDET